MKKILEAFKGAEGEVSSKRLVGIVGAFISICYVLRQFIQPHRNGAQRQISRGG
jgi:hypothetical protein